MKQPQLTTYYCSADLGFLFRSLQFTLLVFGVSSCTVAAPISDLAIAALNCRIGDQSLIRDTLYFGRNIPGGGKVTDEEWQAFVNEVVTSRFPDGLTIVEGRGQWKGANGQIEQERSAIVTLLHNGSEGQSQAIEEIQSLYKSRFRQEAVLRERIQSCASF